ncbi:hypothetical protein CPB86DRAFT_786740 [Serendipita vermifera]|nr:hypothetical protein CPB86DRAFT_786740 [Serendipita vermifera]
MTCRKPAGCGHEFCWLCLAPWNTINTTGHYDYCPDYVGFLGGNPAATRLRFRI